MSNLLCLLALLAAEPAFAEKRVALVIGNAAYKHAPALANPKNDAEGVAAALKLLNFEVVIGTDLDKPGMERMLEAFVEKLEKADVALFFYAGHGLMVNGRNYLIPVDSKLDKESDLTFRAVPAEQVQQLMEQAQRTNIIILDACRDNPLARSLARSMGTRSTNIGRGLGAMKAGIGTLLVYATQPGNEALDGEGKNSPFTTALLQHIATPGIEVREVLTRVRATVYEATKARPRPQIPWDESSLMSGFYFTAAPAARETPATPPSPAPPSGPTAESENLFWQSIRDSKSAADFKAYLARYPQGTFAELAKLRIAELEKAAAVTPPAPPPPDKPAPPAMPPAPPKRTSTFEVGVARLGGQFMVFTRDVPNARTCQARCLANVQCVVWRWAHETRADDTARRCTLYKAPADDSRGPDPHSTSGVIRTTPAAAPAPQAPKPQPTAPTKPAPAPPATGDLAAEMRRKANAREKEGGFCARTNWPRLGPMELVIKGLPTGAHLEHFPGVQCTRWQIDPEFVKEGLRFKIVTKWTCGVGSSCHASRSRYCYNAARSQWMWFADPNPTDFSQCR